MKTYPFIHMLINLYWLLLFILIGFLVSPVYNYFYTTETTSLTIANGEDVGGNSTVIAALSSIEKTGKKLFRTNCATCHNKDMKSDMTGPTLSGVTERWSDFPISDLYSWVRNSSKMVEDGHPRAVEIYNKWDKDIMTAFNGMSDEDIESILAYVEGVK